MTDILRKLCLLIITVSFAAVAVAQIPDIPEFGNEPMLINKDNSLKRLEQGPYQSYESVPDGTVAEDGTPEVYRVAYDGARSPVRVGRDARFIIKLTDVELDPEALFFLTRVDTDRKHRDVHTTLGTQYEKNVMGFKLVFKKVAPGVYIITTQRALEGHAEYAFVFTKAGTNKPSCFLFGID